MITYYIPSWTKGSFIRTMNTLTALHKHSSNWSEKLGLSCLPTLLKQLSNGIAGCRE